MKVTISSRIKIIELLHELGICTEAVLITVNGKLVPETAIVKKGDDLEIIFYKHPPPFFIQQELKEHWKKTEYKNSCKFCKAKPATYLPQPKEHLCKQHFIRSVEKRVKKAIRIHKMLRKGEHIGIALSGGKDSFALLHILSKMQKLLPFELCALIVDEGIPGYRNKVIENAYRACKKSGVEKHTYSFQEEYGTSIVEIGKKGKKNLCSYCGVLRRKILNSKARELGLDKIAVGHNLDDVAQTGMLNLVRNEPLRFGRFEHLPDAEGKMIPRIRPLRGIREKEIATYALLMGHSYNSKCCCPYSKNALRRSVRHELNFLEDKYPGTKSKMASCFDTLNVMVADSISNKNFKIKFCKCGEPSSTNLCMGCKMLKEL